MNSGLYQISIGDFFYFGQAQDLKRRKYDHLSKLKKGTHENPIMQNVYDKYQEFDFKEVLHCSVEELNQQEQRLLDAFWRTEGCMNICQYAEASFRGRKHSEETKKKMSEAQKGEKHHMYGKQHSEEAKRKMSLATKGEKNSKYNPTEYTFIHDEHGQITCTRYELLTKYSLNSSNISGVISGRRKSHQGWKLKDPF